ncbi:unnamed protein product [Urochloa decumbens]|uniref:Uncharacterized protein n=1 Tax=Urochloa decumbens TaxID=240449 RepID=A0ABC9GZY7_9POAL
MAEHLFGLAQLHAVHFQTLEEALRIMVVTPAHARPLHVSFAQIRVRDAPAVVAFLAVSQREAGRKNQFLPMVDNEAGIHHLAAAAGILGFLDVMLLPALLLDPDMTQPLVDALEDCSKALRVEAEAVGGAFGAVATALSNSLHNYYLCTPVQKPQELMRGCIVTTRDRVRALLDATYPIAV